VRLNTLALICGVAFWTTTCGNHSPASPATPSSSAAPAAPTSATGATISGNVAGMSSNAQFRTLNTSLTVSVTGTSVSSGVDSSGHFLLMNVPAGHVELHFTGPGVDARLTLADVADHQTITVTVHINATSASLDENETDDQDHNSEIEGIVSAVGSNSLTVAGKLIMVTPTTVIVHGDTKLKLSDIKIGDRVHVKATMSGTTLVATKIEDQNGAAKPGEGDDQGDDHGGNNNTVELSGKVAGRSTGCPVTFTIGSTTVVTNSSTKFEDTTCAALKNGDKVEVKGTKQTNGSVLASKVEKDD